MSFRLQPVQVSTLDLSFGSVVYALDPFFRVDDESFGTLSGDEKCGDKGSSERVGF